MWGCGRIAHTPTYTPPCSSRVVFSVHSYDSNQPVTCFSVKPIASIFKQRRHAGLPAMPITETFLNDPMALSN